MTTTPLYNWAPSLWIMALGALFALLPIAWVAYRQRPRDALGWLRGLTWVALFLTFDLVLIGAFTRLSDSGLGCPDWPGCYGSVSPWGAHAEISEAQAALPSGPVTHSKAWIEMLHRYFATGVGALTALMAVLALCVPRQALGAWQHRTAWHRWLAVAILVWTCLQGAFGALTVTMQLFPLIVSLHLMGAYVLLALLTLLAAHLQRLPGAPASPRTAPALSALAAPRWLWRCTAAGLALLCVQAASGAWVSTNYAVLACTEFPQCQGQWLPPMDFSQAFSLWRPLGSTASGETLGLPALTAIHWVHRTLAIATGLALAALAWRLHRVVAWRRPVRALAALVAAQWLTGLSNVVLGWPLLAAMLHTAGAGAMVALLVWLLAQAGWAHRAAPTSSEFPA